MRLVFVSADDMSFHSHRFTDLRYISIRAMNSSEQDHYSELWWDGLLDFSFKCNTLVSDYLKQI